MLNDGSKTDDLVTNRPTPSQDRRPWHSVPLKEVMLAFGAHSDGLSDDEARRRLERHGLNLLPPAKPRSMLRRYIAQFENLLLQVLLGTVVVMAAIGHFTAAAVILAVVLVNATMGFVQEGKAESAIRAIQRMLAPKATVLRGGRRQTVAAETLVPGDIVLIESGDRVPADIRLIRVKNLRVQEAALTGESVPVEKSVNPIAVNAPIGDRASLAFSGTLVTYGQANGVVIGTGVDTELGGIRRLLAEVIQLETPLLRQMAGFARTLTVVILAAAVLVFAFGVLVRGQQTTQMFLAVVSLAVAAIPEGLPAILSVAMAIGVQRMAQRHAIIRRLPAVETLGSVSVICSDKTGTLTRNEMAVRRLVTSEHDLTVSGVGYEPRGAFSIDGDEVAVSHRIDVMAALRIAALCNDAGLRQVDGEWTVDGDPLEGALLSASSKAGLNLDVLRQDMARIDIIPFESEHRYMATLNHGHGGDRGLVCVKGAPEKLLEMCTLQHGRAGSAPLEVPYWRERIETMAAEGQRVIAVASKPAEVGQSVLRGTDLDQGLVFVALFGLIDPPREEAIAAVVECRAAGIRVKMITGDHAVTARAIASQLGFENTSAVLTGAEIETMPPTELAKQVSQVDVFARASPEHKLRLVEALQADGLVVAMTGDGVNDAPALKRADIGIAMGIKGTEAAKEAAQVVLADDNFASIVNAVREGRTVYDNLKKAIVFLLPVNGGESLSIVLAILLGATLPITPLQILWINMVSSLALALALAFEPTEPGAMSRPPRPANEALLSPFLVWRIVFVSTLFLIGIFGMFKWALWHGASVEKARTFAVNTLVVMEVFYLFSVRYLDAPSLTARGVLGTTPVLASIAAVVVLQLLFTYAPFMERFFETRPIGIIEGLPIIAAGIALFAILEFEKVARRSWGSRDAGPVRPSHDHGL